MSKLFVPALSAVLFTVISSIASSAFAAEPPKFTQITCSLSDGPGSVVGFPLTKNLNSVGGFAEFDISYGDFTAHLVKLGNLVHMGHGQSSGVLTFDENGIQMGWISLLPYGVICSLHP